MTKVTVKFVIKKKYNFVTVTITKEKNNAVTSKVIKKVTYNDNFITNNELFPFFARDIVLLTISAGTTEKKQSLDVFRFRVEEFHQTFFRYSHAFRS